MLAEEYMIGEKKHCCLIKMVCMKFQVEAY